MLTIEFLSEKTGDPIRSVSQPVSPANKAIIGSNAKANCALSQCLPALPTASSYLPFSFHLSFPSLNPISYLRTPPIFSFLHTLPPSARLRKPSPDTFLLTRPMVSGRDGVVLRPRRGGDKVVGGVGVRVGREDARGGKEVSTTGWVIVRFTPRPTGVR
jgi:hypothetical protein